MHILLVEDRRELCKILKESFEDHGIHVDVAYDGEAGLSFALTQEYAVIILDIMLPSLSGVELLNEIRKNEIFTPVLMLTALDSVDSKVDAFECGADDYLVKNSEFRELLARVRALAKRPRLVDLSTLTVGNVTLKRKTYSVEMNGRPVELARKMAVTLEYLFLHKEKFVSRETILRAISQHRKAIEAGNVEVYIHFLRKKMPPEQAGFVIETKRQYGYRVTETEARDV